VNAPIKADNGLTGKPYDVHVESAAVPTGASTERPLSVRFNINTLYKKPLEYKLREYKHSDTNAGEYGVFSRSPTRRRTTMNHTKEEQP
jgi:hypothetical protein